MQGSVADYERLTRAATEAGARVVVWPETTLPRGAAEMQGFRAWIARALPPDGWLLAGSFSTAPDGEAHTNSAVVIDAAGALRDRYDKVALVPFGEYVPFRQFVPWIGRYGVPESDLAAGTAWRPVSLGETKVGVSICFESSLAPAARAFTLQGAQLLAVITSDGWAGRSSAALQHAAMAPLRAVENRRSIARAAATGVSELIDPYGRVTAAIPLFTQNFAVADLPLRQELTVYTRIGDWPLLLCAGLLAYGLRTRKREGSEREPK
jgi:apolipoprotein N-acyltransferase